MLSSENKKFSVKTSSSPLGEDFGKDYIRTMRDDLSLTGRSSASIKAVPIGNEPFPKSAPPSKGLPASSPFFNQGESEQESSELKKTSPVEVKNYSTENKIAPQKSNPPFQAVRIDENPSSARRLVMVILGLLLLITLLVGSYYFWITREPQDPIESGLLKEEISQTTEENQITINPVSEKYSYETPNYLPINLEISSPDEIKKIIASTATELGGIQTKSPFEFIITDSNKNPIAFPIFSVASALNLSPKLLSALEEKFSFFIYNDLGEIRTGLVIEMKDEKAAMSEMLQEESTLTKTLSFLFLSEPPADPSTVFKTGSYNSINVRYFNFPSDASFSIDYASYDNKLIIATSKNTLRAIVDGLLSQKMQNDSTSADSTPPIQ